MPIFEATFSVCSNTLWIGHLSKRVEESDLSGFFGEFGVVEWVLLVPPRGCGFVGMNRRLDAAKALKGLNRRLLNGKKVNVRLGRF